MTPEEVAETLGISRWTVYSRLERATKAMRAAAGGGRPARHTTTDRQEALR